MANKLNEVALSLIEKAEGIKLTAYQDIAGHWTIGYGHTPAYPGQVITAAYAQILLKNDLMATEQAVTNVIHDCPTTDNQFSAMVSLTYNIGANAFKSSSILRFHRLWQYEDAAKAFLLWDKARIDGILQEIPGLLNRRIQEMALYMTS